jgi:hypothetical protein
MVEGTVSDPEATVTVTVNDEKVDGVKIEDGTFSVEVQLAEDENTIQARAVRGEEGVNSRPITVFHQLTGEITSPAYGAESDERSIAVEGKVSNPNAGVTINSVVVEVDPDGGFSPEVVLDRGENTIKVKAVLGVSTWSKKITVTCTALGLEITSPEDGAKIDESSVTVEGKVSDARVKVSVNGVPVEVAGDGSFSVEVELEEGENTIKVKAVLGGDEVTKTITVYYTPAEALILEITSLDDGEVVLETPVTVEGTVSNAEAQVTVSSVVVGVVEEGGNFKFSTQVDLKEGKNIITAKAVLGEKEVIKTIAVTYTPKEEFALKVISPKSGAEIAKSSITVKGKVSNAEATVTINGIVVGVSSDGSFATHFGLEIGKNTITAKAVVEGEEPQTDEIEVTDSTKAVTLEIISPEISEGQATVTESPMTLIGTVFSEYEDITVTVNGVEVEVAQDGGFLTQVELEQATNITVRAIAYDEEGNAVGDPAEKTITVTYTPEEALTLGITSPEISEAGQATVTESPVAVTGTVSDPNAQVTVNNVVVGEAQGGEGQYTFSTQVELEEGENVITAKAVLGEKEVIKTITVNYTPEEELTLEITSPEISEGEVTVTESWVTVEGSVSDAEATVTINGIMIEVDEDGSFSIDIWLVEGQNEIKAKAVLGEEEVSKIITVKYDPGALSLEITSPEDGAEVAISPVTVKGIVSDAGATVTVNDAEVEVAEDGSFSAEVDLTTEGENTIKVKAMLNEGEVTKTITVTYTPDVLALKITSPEDGDKVGESPVTIKGKVSKKDAIVSVNYVKVDVHDDGSFSAQVELAAGRRSMIEIRAMLDEEEVIESITITYSPAE